MKRKFMCFFTILTLSFSMFLITGCEKQKNKAFIGEFTSTWIDVQHASSIQLSFILILNSDKTVSLERKTGSTTDWTKTGTWAGNKSKDNYGIICMFDDTDKTRNALGTYLTLTQIDDGRLTASPSMTYAFGGSSMSCFGNINGSGYPSYFVSIVVFSRS